MRYFAYYIEGDNLIIAEKQTDNTYRTPTTELSDAIILRYIPIEDTPGLESDTIPLNNELSLALLNYVKYRFYEDKGEYRRANVHKRQFYSIIASDNKRKRNMTIVSSRRGVYSL